MREAELRIRECAELSGRDASVHASNPNLGSPDLRGVSVLISTVYGNFSGPEQVGKHRNGGKWAGDEAIPPYCTTQDGLIPLPDALCVLKPAASLARRFWTTHLSPLCRLSSVSWICGFTNTTRWLQCPPQLPHKLTVPPKH